MRLISVILIFGMVLIACMKDTEETDAIKERPCFGAPAPPFGSDSDTLLLNGKRFVLEVYLWRDFMPVSPPNGQPLAISGKLICLDDSTVMDSIHIVTQCVWNNGFCWCCDLEDDTLYRPDPQTIEFSCNGGPLWEVGDTTDVALSFIYQGYETIGDLKVVIEATY